MWLITFSFLRIAASEDFELMKEKVQKASDAAIAKKEKVIEHIRGN